MKNWIVVFLFTGSVAHAIGRTGNEVVGEEDGFTALAPATFNHAQPMGDGNLRLLDPFAPMSFPGKVPAMLELLRVEGAYPEFRPLTRMDIVLKLGADGWYQVPSHDPCVSSFALEDGKVALGLSLWGPSRGVLIRSTDRQGNRQAIKVILSSLEIEKGACDWK